MRPLTDSEGRAIERLASHHIQPGDWIHPIDMTHFDEADHRAVGVLKSANLLFHFGNSLKFHERAEALFQEWQCRRTLVAPVEEPHGD